MNEEEEEEEVPLSKSHQQLFNLLAKKDKRSDIQKKNLTQKRLIAKMGTP